MSLRQLFKSFKTTKERSPPSTVFLLASLILLLVCCFKVPEVKAWWPREYPRIGLSRWLELDEDNGSGGAHGWRSDFDNITQEYLQILDRGQTYIASSQIIGLGFECNATYPVMWISHTDQDATPEFYSYYLRAQYVRTNPDVFNPRSNIFTAILDFFGEYSIITGNYSCVSTEYPDDVIKSIYVYWQGTNPSNLILSGKTIEVQSRNGQTVVLPCRTSKPDVQVDLYKEGVSHEYISIRSPYIKYDQKIGFTINLYQYPQGYGKFKCSVGEDDDEAVFITLKKGVKDAQDYNNSIIGNATLYFNRTTQEIVCCSNTFKSPKLHTLFCVEPFSCEMRRAQLLKTANNGKRWKSGTCTSERVYTKDSGLLKCSGDGIDIIRNFYTDLPTKKNNHSSHLYFKWQELKGDDMIDISITSRRPIYHKQNITVSCETSYNYFSEGMQWAVRWRNQSLKFFPTPYAKNSFGTSDIYEPSQFSFQSIRLQINIEMEELICFAPVWNSTMWFNKTFSLDVHETKSPFFPNGEKEVIQWKINDTDQILECKAKGAPSPLIRWKKNNKTLIPESNLALKKRNGTAILSIRRVSYDSHGTYKCVASNLAGSVVKEFIIYVEDPNSSLGALGITAVALMIVGLLSGMGFLIFKMNLQKKLIDHLAGIVFRDVNGVEGTGSGGGGNGIAVATEAVEVVENSSVLSNNNIVSLNGNSSRNPFPSSLD